MARALREAPEVDVSWALAAFVALIADPGLGWDGGHLTPAAFVLAGATSLPLVVRRRYPLGTLVAVTAESICVHSDTPNAAEIGPAVRAAIEGAGRDITAELHRAAGAGERR